MGSSWVTIQLPYAGETATEAQILNSLLSILPELEVFIPVLTYRDKRGDYNYNLFEGYIFVRGDYADADYIALLSSPYVQQVLTTGSGGNGRFAVAYTSDAEIEEMRSKLNELVPSDFSEGDRVCIVDGVYKDLKGKIVKADNDTDMLVEVYMPWGSLTKLTTVPKMFLCQDTEENDHG